MASIRKRGQNSYLIVVSRGYDYEGNRLKAAQKTVHPPKDLTPGQCKKWLNEQAVLFEREVRHDPQPVNHAMTLAAYTEHWLKDIAPGRLAASTYSRDQQDIRRILPALGHYKLTDLRKETIRAFYEAMRSEPKLTDGQPLSERSVEGLHNTLCSILSGAVDEGYLTHNPAWRVYKPKGVRKERPVADEETVQKLIAALETQSMKYEVYFKLVLATGMRRGEACGLRWSDIDWRHRTIHVQRTVVKLSGQKIFTKEPKTASGNRRVYISTEMCKLLKSVEAGMYLADETGRRADPDGGRLPLPAAERRSHGTHDLYLPLQENPQGKWAASKLICPQPAPYQRQPAHCPGSGCPHRGGTAWSFPAQYHTRHLCPRL